jgi:hypothetical protein
MGESKTFHTGMRFFRERGIFFLQFDFFLLSCRRTKNRPPIQTKSSRATQGLAAPSHQRADRRYFGTVRIRLRQHREKYLELP